jgi:rfaE bifunctional protein nucleotidyltransferase chain/domain
MVKKKGYKDLRRYYSDQNELKNLWPEARPGLKRIVFTNGCFDILHAGHVAYLEEARALGDFLVLGLNSDHSISSIKGPTRPIIPFEQRALMLSGLRAVNLVVGFDEETPARLIEFIDPHILVKGGDWSVEEMVGSEFVLSRGGRVQSLQFKTGISTSSIIEKIINQAHPQ